MSGVGPNKLVARAREADPGFWIIVIVGKSSYHLIVCYEKVANQRKNSNLRSSGGLHVDLY